MVEHEERGRLQVLCSPQILSGGEEGHGLLVCASVSDVMLEGRPLLGPSRELQRHTGCFLVAVLHVKNRWTVAGGRALIKKVGEVIFSWQVVLPLLL